MTNSKKLGKLQKDLKNFIDKFPNEWHHYSKDITTERVVNSMVKRGFIEIDIYHDFRKINKQ